MKTLYKVHHCLSSKPAASSFGLQQFCDCAVLPQPPKWICELVPSVLCSFFVLSISACPWQPCQSQLCAFCLHSGPSTWSPCHLLCHYFAPNMSAFLTFQTFFPQFSNFPPGSLRARRGNSFYWRNHFLLICFTYWHLIQDFLLVVVVA